jgi:GNAT superfamily N-acetyltransferase
MIRLCDHSDLASIWTIINDAAQVYQGVIPEDCWKEPYMSENELRHEIEDGVAFWGYAESKKLIGVMGIQAVQGVTLIRHAYVVANSQKRGIGALLLSHLRKMTPSPILIGTWSDALWAIRFYEKHGFQIVRREQKNRLLKQYWTVPERQIQASAVLADQKWRELNREA